MNIHIRIYILREYLHLERERDKRDVIEKEIK